MRAIDCEYNPGAFLHVVVNLDLGEASLLDGVYRSSMLCAVSARMESIPVGVRPSGRSA